MELRGKTVLVTGGAVRIGRALCETLASHGCHVLIHYRDSMSEADALAEQLVGLGVRAWLIRGSLDSENGCRAVLEKAWSHSGGFDFLVNNAAVYHRDSLADSSEERMLAEWRVNLMAPILLTREFAKRGAEGKIVNILDRRVSGYEKGCLPYLLSKKALGDFTRTAALELAPAFTVNGVAPGPVFPPPGRGEEYFRDLAGPIPLQHRIAASDIAEAVVFLLRADSITGQILFVDGGQHLLGVSE